MKKIITLSLLLSICISFSQQTNKNTKIIRGFVFEKPMMPLEYALIEIKETGKKIMTDECGKFEIEAKEGDLLVISFTGFQTSCYTVTDKNCYKIDLNEEAGNPFITRKIARHERKRTAEIVRKFKRMAKKAGFYDCLD